MFIVGIYVYVYVYTYLYRIHIVYVYVSAVFQHLSNLRLVAGCLASYLDETLGELSSCSCPKGHTWSNVIPTMEILDIYLKKIFATVPRGSRYLTIKEFGLKDDIYHGFADQAPS